MKDTKEFIGHVSTATGCCLEITNFSPPWIAAQSIIFLISTGLSVFDTWTDWEVVKDFEEVGFSHPLLPHDVHWLRAWYLFASIGTILTIIAFLHDGISLLYSVYLSCCAGSTDEFTIDDPFKCCYVSGWNEKTRNETLSTIVLWFQDFPMLMLAVLYTISQTSCKVPDSKDVTPILVDVGISTAATTVVSLWRLLRSFVRLCVRGNCCKNCSTKEQDRVYPSGTCAQCCILPFFCGLVLQFIPVLLAAFFTIGIWSSLYLENFANNFDDSLGVYRFSSNGTDERLFNVSAIIPPNGTFVHFEKIPKRYLNFDADIFCLSEFEYRSDESQIFFNTVQLAIVSKDSRFCASRTGIGLPNYCAMFYPFQNSALYYGFTDPTTGELKSFSDECTVLIDGLRSGPVADLNINVTRHINKTSFAENNEPLVIFYPNPVNVYLSVSAILSAPNREYNVLHTFQDSPNITCLVRFIYNETEGQIRFNYRDINPELGGGCSCSVVPGPNCRQFHGVLWYGYFTPEGFVPYTHCSDIPIEELIPYHDPRITVGCSCQ